MPGGSHDPAAARPVALNTVITSSLEKVLQSNAFSNAGSLRELLRFAVRETLAGRGTELKEYVLGTVVLKKPASFDPKTDPIVRVQMRRVRDRLQRYYTAEGRFDSLLIDIPRGTYVPVFRCIDAGAAPVARARETLTVGRERELSALRSGFESAAAGYGRMVCLCGEPGIGKTTRSGSVSARASRIRRLLHRARGVFRAFGGKRRVSAAARGPGESSGQRRVARSHALVRAGMVCRNRSKT